MARIRITAGRAALGISIAALVAAVDGPAWAGRTLHGATVPNDSITSAEIVNGAVIARTIAGGAVTTPKLAGEAVTAAKLASGAVTSAKLANDAVTSAKIKDANVTAALLAKGAVTGPKIAANAVTAPAIAGAAVTTAKIAAGAVTRGKLATDARLPKLIMRTNAMTVQDGTVVEGRASCVAGEVLISGAASWQAVPSGDLLLSSSAPVPTGTAGQLPSAWAATFVNAAGGAGPTEARTWAICVQP
jgi:hypothetical protein